MWKIILVCVVLIGSASTVQRKRYISSSSGRGNYAPDYGFIDPFEFHQKLTQQILAQQSAQNRALTSVYASDDASAFAEASNYPDYDELFHEQFAHQQAFFDALRRQTFAAAAGGSGSYSGAGNGYYGGSGGYAPNYASASGTYGSNGAHQSAAIYPENPSIPNINNRFSESSIGGGNGYRGVAVSSYAHSADINGKKTSQRGATTTINDNGKITSYNVHS